MKVKLWGVRGSLPSPVAPERLRWRIEEALQQFERLKDAKVPISARAFLDTLPPHMLGGYGGNTSCGEVTCGDSRLIIDAGSGIRALSDILSRSEPAISEYHIYFTHFHWDHLIGLPFFAPIYARGKTIHLYAVHDQLEEAIQILFKKPFFPVPFAVIQKQVKFHKLEARKPFQIGDLSLTPYQLDHPDECWGVRVEGDGKSLAWCVDNEGTRGSREELGDDVKLFQNADLMVYDAQYSFGEALEKMNWGHSSAPVGIDLAVREGVKRALFVHHDPAARDETIREAEEQTQQYFDALARARKKAGLGDLELQWHFGREGELVKL
jgi:phosphoribosyl 1,2-cyclic phosphodiesterase